MKAPQRNPFAAAPVAALRYKAVMDLISEFFRQESERQKDQLNKLIRRNVPFSGSTDGFTFEGVTFTELKRRPSKPFSQLDGSLHDEAKLLITVGKKMEADRERMRRSLAVLFNRCETTQEFRDALPEPLVTFLPSARGLTRTRDAGALLAENPLLQRDFQTLLDIVFYYEANRLVF